MEKVASITKEVVYIEITHWIDEYSIPDWVDKLLKIPDLPMLKCDLLTAKKEVSEYGVVKYTTKARINYWIHEFYKHLDNSQIQE